MQHGRAQVDVVAMTDIGRLRQRNEDCAVVAETVMQAPRDTVDWQGDAPVLLAALDGLGGHPSGDVASRLGARALAAADDPADVSAAIRAAHAAILAGIDAGEGRPGMGSTVVVAVVDRAEIIVGSLGDSPALLVRDDGLELLTTTDRARFGGLTSFAGDTYNETIDPHVRRLPRERPIRLLLATDGLTDVLDAATVHRLAHDGSPAAAARALVDATLGQGAPDNVTVVIADIPAGD